MRLKETVLGLYYDDPERKFCLTKREYAVTIDDFLLALKPVLIDPGSISGEQTRTVHRSMIFIGLFFFPLNLAVHAVMRVVLMAQTGLAGSLQDIHFTSLFSALHEHNIYLQQFSSFSSCHPPRRSIDHYARVAMDEKR